MRLPIDMGQSVVRAFIEHAAPAVVRDWITDEKGLSVLHAIASRSEA